MDIKLDADLDGIELVKSFNRDNSMTVIYMTGYPERVIDTGDTSHHLIDKPINYDALGAGIQYAIDKHQRLNDKKAVEKPDIVKIYDKSGTQRSWYFVEINNIAFVMKAGNDHIMLYTYDGKTHKKTSNLKRFLNEYDTKDFIQIERGIVVRKDFEHLIKRYEEKPFNLIIKWNEKERCLPIGKSFIKRVKELGNK
jgi:DNA-binding LytR/AlgR family response regulator